MQQNSKVWRFAAAFILSVVSPLAADDVSDMAELIDRHIQVQLEAKGLPCFRPASDAEFLRRVFLDLHGVIPSAPRARQFLESTDDRKRRQLTDELLSAPRFGEHLGDLWRGYLLSPLVNEQRTESRRFADLLADRFNRNEGWNRIAFELLTASGKIEDNAAVTYLIEGRYPLSVTDLTDLSSRYFLGVRLNCAQCHDHPFGEWKRQDYWGMAAFFAQIQTPGRPKRVYLEGIQDDPGITLTTMQRSDAIEGFQTAPPTFLGGKQPPDDTQATLRATLAEWTTSAENPWFARAMVNRMWWHFFGRGIVHPVDDMHSRNPPSHPELLDQLSRRFVEGGFDLKLLCRSIVMSRTYQQTSQPSGESDPPQELLASMPIKVLSGEQLYDSLVQILGPPEKTPAVLTRTDARHEFSQFFSRDSDSEPTRYDYGIPQVLRLMNSPQFADQSISALVSRLSPVERSPDDILDDMFLTILARFPEASERDLIRAQLADHGVAPHEVCRQLAWSLLMSSEFILNH